MGFKVLWGCTASILFFLEEGGRKGGGGEVCSFFGCFLQLAPFLMAFVGFGGGGGGGGASFVFGTRPGGLQTSCSVF